MREAGIEKKTIKALEALGCICLKVGHEGWPDRLILVGQGRHFWIEFKSPTGRLRPDQKLRIKKLMRIGDPVLVLGYIPSPEELASLVASARGSVPVPA